MNFWAGPELYHDTGAWQTRHSAAIMRYESEHCMYSLMKNRATEMHCSSSPAITAHAVSGLANDERERPAIRSAALEARRREDEYAPAWATCIKNVFSFVLKTTESLAAVKTSYAS